MTGQNATTEQNQSSNNLINRTLTVKDILLMDGIPEEEIEEYMKNLPREISLIPVTVMALPEKN